MQYSQASRLPSGGESRSLHRTGRGRARMQCLFALASLSTFLAGSDGPMAYGTPGGFRGSAIFAPLPAFPTETLKAGREGRVVVQVVANYPPGAVQSLTFLETVDEHTKESVSEALQRWRFRPLKTRDGTVVKGVPFTGRLTFHFMIRDGKPVVVDEAASKSGAQESRRKDTK